MNFVLIFDYIDVNNMIVNKYKIYRNKKKNRKLNQLCNSAASIWNHTVLLHRRYYKLFGKSVPKKRMRQQIAKLRKSNRYWSELNSQTVQEVVDRVYESYDRFFKKISKRPPKTKKWKDFKSIVFTQSGWKIDGNCFTINKVVSVKFSKSREYYDIRNIRIKRDSVGDWWIIITSSRSINTTDYAKSRGGASIGFDFSLPKFLIGSDDTEYNSPLFYYEMQDKIAKLNKNLSKKKKGSKNRQKAKKDLARAYRKLKNKREDHHWKLAHELCRKYDFIAIEDLNMDGMKKMWGKKVSDLSFSSFVLKLEYVSSKYGTVIHKIDRWYASSKTCGDCGTKNTKLKLSEREWVCEGCGSVHNRDENASNNILRQGIVEYKSKCKTDLSATYDNGKESHSL